MAARARTNAFTSDVPNKRSQNPKRPYRSHSFYMLLLIKPSLLQYLPPTQPYELSSLVFDLVRYARYVLKPGGRLVFFLPTVTEEYTEVDVFAMLCEGMEVIANSVQDFGSWGRRVRVAYKCLMSGLLTNQ